MEFSAIVGAAQTYSSVCRFVTDGDLYDTLSTIGDIELKAARLALDSSGLARKPKAQVLLAVGHLQSAVVSYRQAYERLNSNLKRSASVERLTESLSKAQWVNCLMALCYLYLGEIPLAKKAVESAKEANELKHKLWVDTSLSGVMSFFNPSEYKSAKRNRSSLLIADSDFNGFYKLIKGKRNSRNLRGLR